MRATWRRWRWSGMSASSSHLSFLREANWPGKVQGKTSPSAQSQQRTGSLQAGLCTLLRLAFWSRQKRYLPHISHNPCLRDGWVYYGWNASSTWLANSSSRSDFVCGGGVWVGLWLQWVFVVDSGLSLVVENGAYSLAGVLRLLMAEASLAAGHRP